MIERQRDMPAVVGVIPARGGSKGLPRKNLRTIGGRSLVAIAVESALAATTVDLVVGSTDDEAIAEEFIRAGATVTGLRPSGLAADDTPDSPVFLHELDLLGHQGIEPEIVVNLRPTAPLRTAEVIDRVVNALRSHTTWASTKTVHRVSEHPYKMWTMGADDIGEPIRSDWLDELGGDVDLARQALPDVFRSNGVVDATRAISLRATGRFHPGPVGLVTIDDADAIDIDSEHDLIRAAERLGRRA